jgi:hypothetical protein
LAELAGLGAGSDDTAPAFAAATLAMARCALQRGIEGSMRSARPVQRSDLREGRGVSD